MLVMAFLPEIRAMIPAGAIIEQDMEHTISGKVQESITGEPIIGAIVRLGEDYLWTTTDLDGKFIFNNVQKGDYILETSCLGYVTSSIPVSGGTENLTINLHQQSLALDEVVVTPLTMAKVNGAEAYASNACLTFADEVFAGELFWYADAYSEADMYVYYPYNEAGTPTVFSVATDYNKCVCVDIRFILWTLDRYAGMTRIIDELGL